MASLECSTEALEKKNSDLKSLIRSGVGTKPQFKELMAGINKARSDMNVDEETAKHAIKVPRQHIKPRLNLKLIYSLRKAVYIHTV